VERVLERDATVSWALALKGKLLHDTGRREEAIALLREVPIAPETAWARGELASCLFELGDTDAAREAVETALQYSPEDPGAQLLKGRLLIQGDHPEKRSRYWRVRFASIPTPRRCRLS